MKSNKIIFVIVIIIILSLNLNIIFAADALYRLMHNDHDALIIGQIIALSEDKITVEVKKQIISSKDLNSSSPIPQISLEQKRITIQNVERYAYYYDKDLEEGNPQIKDYVLASVNKKGFNFVNAWGIFKVDSLDYKMLDIVFPKNTSKHNRMELFALKTFINSDGHKNDFRFNSATGEVSFEGKVIYKANDNELSTGNTFEEDDSNTLEASEYNQEDKNTTEINNTLLTIAVISCLIVVIVILKLRKK